MSLVPRTVLERRARELAGAKTQFWAAAMDAISNAIDAYAADLIAYAVVAQGEKRGTRVTESAVEDAMRQRNGAYEAWLLEANEAYAQALRKHGIALPRLMPAPVGKARRGDSE